MHIHYFQHDHFEDLGYIGDWALAQGFSTSVTRFDLNPVLPEDHEYDWLVVLGGKMGVNDSAEYTWIDAEIKFIEQAVKLGKIVIGICLGSQLVASALRAKVFRNTEPEMGFWPVKVTDDARQDHVFKHFPNELTVMHMHFDTFELPADAVNMANSKITNCQAFRYGKNVFAFQFHFEVTPSNVDVFIKETAQEYVEGQFSQLPEEIKSSAGCCNENNGIFKNVLDEIAQIL